MRTLVLQSFEDRRPLSNGSSSPLGAVVLGMSTGLDFDLGKRKAEFSKGSEVGPAGCASSCPGVWVLC